MVFRQNREDCILWNRFINLYRGCLTTAGISEIAFRSERDWLYFVEHGYDHQYPDLLNLEEWQPEALEELVPIFKHMLENEFYASSVEELLNWLKARVK